MNVEGKSNPWRLPSTALSGLTKYKLRRMGIFVTPGAPGMLSDTNVPAPRLPRGNATWSRGTARALGSRPQDFKLLLRLGR